MTVPEFRLSYADNESVTMAERLRAEILERSASRLDLATGYLAVSAWAIAGDALKKLEQMRLLLGKDYELVVQTRSAAETEIGALVAQALRDESQPPRLPVPADVESIQEFIAFLERDSVDVRAWRGEGCGC